MQVQAPPPEWQVEDATAEGTAWCRANFPELIDLVEEGALVCVPRRSDYKERRSDGYEGTSTWLPGW